MKKKYNALVIGQSASLCLDLPALFYRAGFTVDFIHTDRYFTHDRKITNFFYAENKYGLIELAEKVIQSSRYDIVIISDDDTISIFKDSNLNDEVKYQILPVVDRSKSLHLASKIGLSKLFEEAGVTTPEYSIALNTFELEKAIQDMGFPLIIKGDFSGGGLKTFDCLNKNDALEIKKNFHDYPAVVQRKIDGDLVAIEAFYQKSKLVHFSYSRVLENIDGKEFSPSVFREYTQTRFVDRQIFNELERIGTALGANGFSNISAIYNHKSKRYYFFEADMRPTVWLDFSRYFGDCLAKKIKNYFDEGKLQNLNGCFSQKFEQKMKLPFYGRMSLLDIIFNKHNVWSFTPISYASFRSNLRKLKHFFLAILNLRFLRNYLRTIYLDARGD